MTSVPIERASAVDMMELASATTPAAVQIGAVLVLAPADALEFDLVRSALAERICGVPRLRQRLRSVPVGCGRPIWVDDPSFDIANHVSEVQCPLPGDRSALFGAAADLVVRRLPPDRPLWSATFITGLTDEATALVLIFHHVMADGMGGLAVLANLVDGTQVPLVGEFPRAAPRTTSLFAEATRTRFRAVVHLRDGFHRLREAAAELGTGRRRARAPRCSLNGPVGPARCMSVARTGLDRIHATARRHDATVNDAVLAAITATLTRFLDERGEHVDHFVVSIPVSGRQSATAARLGNEVGLMLVVLPATAGPVGTRIEAVAAITRASKRASRGASAAILAPAFRIMAATRTLNWLTRHQRMATTFVTNLRGPESHVAFLGAKIAEIVPVNGTSGNVRVAFGVFSYAGALTVTVVADAELAGALPALVVSLQTELERLEAGGAEVLADPR